MRFGRPTICGVTIGSSAVSEKPIGGDFDWQRLRQEVLEPLRRGQAARYSRYDWAADEMAGMSEMSPHGLKRGCQPAD